MIKEYIAIDLGATSGRVVLAGIDEKKVIGMDTLHRFPTPLIEKDGKGLSKVAGHKIESIGIDTWGVDFCKIDGTGKLHLPRFNT